MSTMNNTQPKTTGYFLPYFNLKYFEYGQQVDKAMDLLSNLVIVDGFFYSVRDTNRFSLGFQYNPDRSEASSVCLAKLGYGVGFSRNEEDELYIKSLTQMPVYLLLADSTQITLLPGESKKLFDMSDCIRNNSLPPKKQKDVSQLSVRLSFGEPFKTTVTEANLGVTSPCWCQLTLLKFIDINVLKNSSEERLE